MKRALFIMAVVTSVLSVYTCMKVVLASGEVSGESLSDKVITSGEVSGESGDEPAMLPYAYYVSSSSFKVKKDVDFPDLTVVVMNEKTRKEEEVPHEARREILMAARIGFIEGYEDGTFKPDNPITRAEFIKMLMGFATNRTFNFEAIPSNYQNWAGKYVSLAEMQGIIEKGKYTERDLEQPITRLEVICMLAKVQIKMKGIPQYQLGNLVFKDIDSLTKEEKELVLHAASYDLLEGMKDGSVTELEPNKNITRAETARALMRIY